MQKVNHLSVQNGPATPGRAARTLAGAILAIHPDPTAPIFQAADLCVEAQPGEVLQGMLEALGG